METQKKYDIFISYRREGGKNIARLLKTELGLRGYHAFLDFDELKDGRFDKRIMDAIDAAPVFMFILSEHALDRCVDENDWVRREIEYAMETERHIVPINPDKSFSDFPDYVPKNLKDGLGLHQFSQLLLDDLFNQTMDKLVSERLEPILGKRNRYKMSTTGATIHLSTDANCEVYRYGKHECNVVTGEDKIVYLKKGKHKFEFISIDNEKDKYSIVFSVEDIDMEDMLEIQLQPIIEKREIEERTRREAEERARIEERKIAEEKSRQEEERLRKEKELQEKRIKYLEEAAQRGDGGAKITLAQMYENGEGVERDIDKAIDNYRSAIVHNCFTEYVDDMRALIKEKESKAKEAKSQSLQPISVNGVSFNMVQVQGGTFTIGATPEQESENPWDDERPAHEVAVTDYMIGETAVTQALWEAVMGVSIQEQSKKGTLGSSLRGVGANYPMYHISWDDCQEFVAKLSQLTGKNFRLPTEAEWEFAARGGNQGKGFKYAGSDTLGDVAWHDDGKTFETSPVAQKHPNELGLYDMSGNVWEWCQDWYINYGVELTPAMLKSAGMSHVTRGGSWNRAPRFCRVSVRGHSTPNERVNYVGLRVVMEIE